MFYVDGKGKGENRGEKGKTQSRKMYKGPTDKDNGVGGWLNMGGGVGQEE